MNIRIVKDVVTDPGFGFSVCNMLFYANGDYVGLIASAICTMAVVTLRIIRVEQPSWARDNRFIWQQVTDDRLPLRMLGALVFFVGVSKICASCDNFLPFICCMLFGIGNFTLANSCGTAAHQSKKFGETRCLKLLMTLPETYFALGMTCIGLMAGSTSLFVLPVIAIGYFIAIQNVIHHRPEHKNHPKAYYALGYIIFSLIAFSNGGLNVASGSLVCAFYLMLIEWNLSHPRVQDQELTPVPVRVK